MEATFFLKASVFFIDPMSYNNLSLYDLNILNNINDITIIYFGNIKNEHVEKLNHSFYPTFKYSDKSGVFKFLSYFSSLLVLSRYFILHRPKIIHIQWIKLYHIEPFYYFIIKCFFKLKIIFTAHNIVPHDNGKKHFKSFHNWYNVVDHIIVHNFKTKSDISNLFSINSQSISIIPHGIFDLGPIISKTKTPLLLTFGFLGRLSNYKGLDLVVDSWKRIPEGSAKLIIAGSGRINSSPISMRMDVEIDNNELSNEEFNAYLSKCDVVLLPYKEISQSGLLFTCINYSIPVIVSKLPGLLEPFQFGEIGWQLDDLSENNLTKLLMQLITNPFLVNQISSNNYVWEKVKSHYSWKSIGLLTSNIYKKLCVIC
jgi:D-inositol-3-phosphate glycosyltransferase